MSSFEDTKKNYLYKKRNKLNAALKLEVKLTIFNSIFKFSDSILP